mgnify:CR=1 FL=1
MINKYIQQPFIVEAIEYTGDNLEEVINFTGKHPNWEQWFANFDEYQKHVEAEGNIFKVISPIITKHAVPGDFIVHHPMDDIVEIHKPDAFKEMYQPYTLIQ